MEKVAIPSTLGVFIILIIAELHISAGNFKARNYLTTQCEGRIKNTGALSKVLAPLRIPTKIRLLRCPQSETFRILYITVDLLHPRRLYDRALPQQYKYK